MREEWGVSVGPSIIWRTSDERAESEMNIIMDGSRIVVTIRI